MSLSAVARTTDANLRVYIRSFRIRRCLSEWCQPSFCHWMAELSSPSSLFYIPWQFKLKGLLDSLSTLCFLGNRVSPHKSESAVSEVLPEWSVCSKKMGLHKIYSLVLTDYAVHLLIKTHFDLLRPLSHLIRGWYLWPHFLNLGYSPITYISAIWSNVTALHRLIVYEL